MTHESGRVSYGAGLGAALVAIALWSAAPSLVHLTVQTVDPTYYLLLRFLVVAPLSLAVLPAIARRALGVEVKLLAAFCVLTATNYYCQTLSLQALPASWYIVLFALNPLLSLALLRESISGGAKLSLCATLAGTALFLQTDDFAAIVTVWSVVVMLGNMVTWSLTIVAIARLQRSFSNMQLTMLANCVGLATVVPIWGAGGFATAPIAWDQAATIIAIGVGMPVAFFLFSFALRRAPLFAIVSQYLEPLFGLAVAVVFLREHIGVLQAVGALIVFSSTMTLGMRTKRRCDTVERSVSSAEVGQNAASL